MTASFRLIVGLGNPGEEYANTRHNIGFMAVDAVAEKRLCTGWKRKFKGLVTGTTDFLILKPQTFMNLSGDSVVEAVNFYQIAVENVVVFHDDLDLLPGQVKVKRGGGAGGHNGLKSLDSHLGQDYWRVRLGIGRPVTEQGVPVKGDAVTRYVLNPFSRGDKTWLGPLIEALASEADLLLAERYTDYVAALPRV